MAGTNGQGRPTFRIDMIEPAREDFRRIVAGAIPVGGGPAVAAALRQIRVRLRSDPREFGEPLYHLRGMQMTVRRATIPPLYVEYGVHDQLAYVLIRRVVWLTDGGA